MPLKFWIGVGLLWSYLDTYRQFLERLLSGQQRRVQKSLDSALASFFENQAPLEQEVRELYLAYREWHRDAAPAVHHFEAPAWNSWVAPTEVSEVLWYWYRFPVEVFSNDVAHYFIVADRDVPYLISAAQVGRLSECVSQELVGMLAYNHILLGNDQKPASIEIAFAGDFRQVPGFLWECATDRELAKAKEAAQALVFRLMAAIPPGKVRFTFIDPLDSGTNAAPFMELAEWDERLVDGKAWCQDQEILSKLTELNSHMEQVIQRYLKGSFATIDEYNAAAGEVAEPYRVVVVFDFPAQLGEKAKHLLEQLIKNGRRCGIHTLVVRNTSQRTRHGRDPSKVVAGLHVMVTKPTQWRYNDEALQWPASPEDDAADEEDPSLRRLVMVPDTPPEMRFDREESAQGLFGRVLTVVGEQGRGADEIIVSPQRVEDLVARAIDAGARSDLPNTSAMVRFRDSRTWWTANSSDGLSVPFGLSGATDPAFFEVNTAILSGGLLIGRSGSGKSTLLHALICGAATWYSPEEVELYLLDFKQGVEFLAYGDLALPHARCVAVESEREFGVAILRSLSDELKRRSELFKSAGPGVVDLGTWRDRTGRRLPRILVIIDEFQELLNRSGPLAVEAAGMMDRVIRQGRAFGIHLLLGSQSLSSIDAAGTGITALLRLLPIRIVMASDPSDAAMALGDSNDGALYLTRPGEGVYNRAGGSVEHNVRFQGSFLTADQRHAIVRAARSRALIEGWERKPRVFNGQAAAQVDTDSGRFVSEMRGGEAFRLRIPVGGSLTLDPDITITLGRESGGNLLFVCRNIDLVNGFGSVALTALAAQVAEQRGQVLIIDCSSLDQPAGPWLSPLLSTGVMAIERPRTMPLRLVEIRKRVEDRIEKDETGARPLVLVIWGAHRARDLDPGGTGFGFSGFGEDEGPSADLEKIVRNGPEFGVHTIIWGDSPTTVDRRLSAATAREFGWRITGRLNERDSLQIDVEASALRSNHLACANVDEGRQWIVRGYAPPGTAWMNGAVSSING